GLRDQVLCAARRSLLQSCALALQPALEFPRVRNEKPFEQRTLVAVKRLAEPSRGDGVVEGDDVALQVIEVEPDLFMAASQDEIGAEGASHHVQRLAQGGPRVLLVELRPE